MRLFALVWHVAVAYIIGPAADGREPRWAPAAVALSSAAMALASAFEIGLMWRSAYYVISMSPSEVPGTVKTNLARRLVGAILAVLFAAGATLYFISAPNATATPICGHETCGADAAWCAIATAFAALWLGLVVAARRRLLSISDMPKATSAGDVDV